MTRTMMQVASPALRRWDRRAAMGATTYLCNSSIVRDRVQRIYGIDSQVLNAPHSMIVDGDQVAVGELVPWHEAYIRPYVMVSRLMPYKNVRQAIEAFRMMPDEHLVVVGRGPLEPELRMGLPANVRIVGGLSDAQLRWVYSHGAGIVAPCHEDYGLTPLEGGAFGLPVLALRAGGYLDTVIEGVSGLFFDSPTPKAIAMTVRDNSHRVWDHAAIMRHADRFSEGEFARALHASVDEAFNRSV